MTKATTVWHDRYDKKSLFQPNGWVGAGWQRVEQLTFSLESASLLPADVSLTCTGVALTSRARQPASRSSDGRVEWVGIISSLRACGV